MTVYLFSDIFNGFKNRFFFTENVQDTEFLYEVAYGFMPRKFEAENDEDKIIYDEEEEVTEMYFITEGCVGIGFSLIANGYSGEQYTVALKKSGEQVICDHYVLNNCKSQFVYMAKLKDVHGLALARDFLHVILKKYTHIKERLQKDCYRLYKKQIFNPINEIRRNEFTSMNKKFVGR